MPKLKTNKAMRKRFKVTKNGKVIGSHTLKRHMLADRSPKKKRQARQGLAVSTANEHHIKAGLPYGN